MLRTHFLLAPSFHNTYGQNWTKILYCPHPFAPHTHTHSYTFWWISACMLHIRQPYSIYSIPHPNLKLSGSFDVLLLQLQLYRVDDFFEVIFQMLIMYSTYSSGYENIVNINSETIHNQIRITYFFFNSGSFQKSLKFRTFLYIWETVRTL